MGRRMTRQVTQTKAEAPAASLLCSGVLPLAFLAPRRKKQPFLTQFISLRTNLVIFLFP